MANNKQYNVNTTSSVATSTTPKTVVAVVNAATADHQLTRIAFSADYTAVTAGSYLVELVEFDQTTAGTSTGETANKIGGTAIASTVSSVKRNYTAEPTVGTVLDSWFVPAGASDRELLPLGREYTIRTSKTIGLRVTAPSGAPNVRATLAWEE